MDAATILQAHAQGVIDAKEARELLFGKEARSKTPEEKNAMAVGILRNALRPAFPGSFYADNTAKRLLRCQNAMRKAVAALEA